MAEEKTAPEAQAVTQTPRIPFKELIREVPTATAQPQAKMESPKVPPFTVPIEEIPLKPEGAPSTPTESTKPRPAKPEASRPQQEPNISVPLTFLQPEARLGRAIRNRVPIRGYLDPKE